MKRKEDKMGTELEEKRVWGVHTQDDNLFLKGNVIAIGWRDFGDLSAVEPTREAFKDKYAATYPDAKKGSIPTSSGKGVHSRSAGGHEINLLTVSLYSLNDSFLIVARFNR